MKVTYKEYLEGQRSPSNVFPVVKSEKSSYWLFEDVVRLPKISTFSSAAIANLGALLGKDWFEKEKKKDPEDWHPLYSWFRDALDHDLTKALERFEMTTKIDPWGSLHCLVLLAYDVAILSRIGKAPKKMVERLKNPDGFQGMRYELAVARVLSHSMFDIIWIDNTSPKAKKKNRGEMTVQLIPQQRIGKGVDIAVEAKTVGREKVLGKKYGEKIRANVRAKLEGARSQIKNSPPGLIFIDLNQDTLTKKQWDQIIKEIDDELGDYESRHPEDPANLIVFTNFSWHYKKTEKSEGLLHYFYFPPKSLKEIREEVRTRVVEGVREYSSVPKRFNRLDSISAKTYREA